MAIWTNGNDFVLATGWGIARAGGSQEPSVLRFSRVGLRRDQDPPEIVSFVVLDDEGKRALVQRRGEPPSIWTHGADGGRLVPCEASEIVAAAAAPGGPMVALAAERPAGRTARMVLRGLRVDGTRLVLGDTIPIPEAPRLAWADSMMKEGEGWPEQPFKRGQQNNDDDEPEQPPFDPRVLTVGVSNVDEAWWRGAVRLSANRFGVGLSSTYSGLVAVLDPRTLAFRLAARAPSYRDQFDLFVLPMPAGMLVTLVANYRHTEFVYVDDTATVRGNRTQLGKEVAWGAGLPGLAWKESTALVDQSLGSDEIYALELPALGAKRFTEEPGYLVDGGSSADGATHLLALTNHGYSRPRNWRLWRWTKRGARWRSSEVEMPDFQPVEPPPAPAEPERATGTPALGAIAEAVTPWRARAGEEVVLRVRVENRGGAARGLYVELGGAAIGEGWVSAQTVAVEGSGPPVAFVRKGAVARAELPEGALEAGFVAATGRGKAEPAPVPAQPTLMVELRVRAERVGQGLLSMRAGPRGAAGTAGSGMVGRSFVVDAG